MITRQSMEGYRTTLTDASGPVVSIWAHTESDAEYMAHSDNLEHMRAMEREQARLVAEFAAREHAEFLKIRARA